MTNSRAAALRHRRRMMRHYTGFLLLLSAAIALMPVGSSQREDTKLLLILTGAAFWIGGIGTVLAAVKINKRRKHGTMTCTEEKRVKRIGAFSFFRNKKAGIFDVMMLLSAIGLVVARICRSSLYVLFFLMAMLVFSTGMHCMLNGENYIYLTNGLRRDEKP